MGRKEDEERKRKWEERKRIEEEKKILHIKISSKSVEDMSKEYSFNTAQKNQLNELMSEEYANLFGPLTIKDAKGRTQEFQWTMQPWPWEGGCE